MIQRINIMAPVFLLLAILLQFEGIRSDIYTANPTPKQYCENDAFVSSTPYKGKVFLFPAKIEDRRSDWYGARAYCAENCAQSVSIHSQEENDFFINFGKTFDNNDAQTWIGGQVVNSVGSWVNGAVWNYSNPISATEFANTKDPSENCIHTYVPNGKWYAYMDCQIRDNNIACQRDADWKRCE